MRVRLRSYSSDSSGSGYCSPLRTIIEEREADAEPWSTKNPLKPEDSGQRKEKHCISTNENEKPYEEMSSDKTESHYAISCDYSQDKTLFIHSGNSKKDSGALSRVSRDKDTLSSRDLASKLFPEFFAVQQGNEDLNVQGKAGSAALKTVHDPLVESWLGLQTHIRRDQKVTLNLVVQQRCRISDEELRLLIDENKVSTERFGDVRDLFANRSVTHMTLVSWYCWIVCAMFLYVITLNSVSICGNMYLNFLITSLVDLFGFIGIPILMCFRVGRKKAIAFSLWMAGFAGIVSALLSYYENGSYEAGKIIMAMVLGKIFITIAYNIVYVYSAELFPTVVRNTAMGTSSSAARIGSACAPYIVFS
ncbi:solute carrier family 22 member 15-like, partial [Actinia tenebrosa]|uniref:Solute carrier family 22 member 15-like n=1 Tax=Actinia tenebrosa TaxID=6105 RepID=A0A6P8H1V5_ACTTE